MLTTAKIKWIGTILLAGFLLVSALIGGTWGTSYAADEGVNAPPVITDIRPDAVPAGSPDKTITIYGYNFGDISDTAVRIKGTAVDRILPPIQVFSEGISVVIPADLLVNPTVYLITVVKSTYHSIPTLPPTPWDEESNPWPFTVYEAKFTYIAFSAK